MTLLMFVTDDGVSAEGTGPVLFVGDHAAAVLPHHPRGLAWRYFASIQLDDAMLHEERHRIAAGLRDVGFFVSPRLIYRPALASA